MAIRKVYVDASVVDHDVSKTFLQRLQIKPEIVDDAELYSKLKEYQDLWANGKQILILTRNKGAFLKACPGTHEYTCCGYQILHIGSYCTMDCAYCILQCYFHPPVLKYFVNHEDLFQELASTFQRRETQRIGTGEFTDSLIWEKWSDLTPDLVHRFGEQNHAVLELKTKTININRLKGLAHNKKTILAWSLNTPQVIATQERRTTPINARLSAAAQCYSWGYPLAFHFDPIIIYPGCEKAYRKVLVELFRTVPVEAVVWISLGTLRYMPELKMVIEKRFPESNMVYGEFITGLDGKMRYFKPIRIAFYHAMVRWIRELAPEVTTYLCMEDEITWQQSFGFTPESRGGLPAMLDDAARRHCGVK